MSSAGENLWGEEEPFSDMPETAQTVYDEQGRAIPAQRITYDAQGNAIAPQNYSPPVPPPQPQQQQRQPMQPQQHQPQEEVYEEVEETEEDDADVLTDADLRLEQGKLYKLIMKHDLFADVEADERAIQNVQKAIRKFAKEQMEIMLGMRSEQAPVGLQVAFPFNAMEVEVLKMLASTATKGATEDAEEYVPEVHQAPRKATLNPIGGPRKQARAPKPLPAKPQAPVKRNRSSSLDETIERIAREEGVPRELLEEGQLLNKPVRELTPQELEERNRIIAQRRQGQVVNPQRVPMATQAEMEQRAIVHASSISSGLAKSPILTNLIDKVKAMPRSLNHVDY